MNKSTLKNFVIIAACLLFAALCFMAAESRGRVIESRFGLISIAGIALLLFFAAILSPRNK